MMGRRTGANTLDGAHLFMPEALRGACKWLCGRRRCGRRDAKSGSSLNPNANRHQAFRNHTTRGYEKKKSPTNRERLIRGFTKFNFTVDEEKGQLNPSRDKN